MFRWRRPIRPAPERAIAHKLRRQLGVFFEQHLACARRHPPAERLTGREREVAGLVATGHTNDEVARRLHVSVDTVKKHFSRVLAKTGCANRTQFVRYWLTTPER